MVEIAGRTYPAHVLPTVGSVGRRRRGGSDFLRIFVIFWLERAFRSYRDSELMGLQKLFDLASL